MSQEFINYHDQILLLKSKGLVINDETFAMDKLKECGYFSLIGGYKDIFKDPSTRKFVNTSFEDIYRLYQFDYSLRNLIFKFLCEFEEKFTESLSYNFCLYYGENQNQYLNAKNYELIYLSEDELSKLIKIMNNIIIKDNQHPYIVHHRNKYGNVPLWVLLKSMQFGNKVYLYSAMKPNIKFNISKNFISLNSKQLFQISQNLVLFRNVCAHNERLYSFRTIKNFPDTLIHKKMKIPKKGEQYICGKNDLFGVVISLKLLLPKETFKIFMKESKKLISRYLKSNYRLTNCILLKYMGFPENWKNITRYK